MKKDLRINQLQTEIKRKGLGGVLLFYSRDIFYYTGTAQPSYLAVLPDDFMLFVKSGIEFAKRDVFISQQHLKVERKLDQIHAEMFAGISPKQLGVELDVLPANRFFELQQVFEGVAFLDISPFILEQRMRKDPEEISHVEEAARAIDAGHQAVLSTSLTGLTELEVAAKVENAQRLAGHEGSFFFRTHDFFMSRGPLAAGENLSQFSGVVYSVTGTGLSASVPVGPSRKRIESGEAVVVDIPTSINGYHADQTRTYVAGRASQEMKELYHALREVHEYLLYNIHPGMPCQEIYRLALAQAKIRQLDDSFLNFGNHTKSMLIGHGIGLEVNEPPVISSYNDKEIGEDFVIAIELHLYKESIGVLKLEDTLLVGKEKNRILTISSRDLSEL